MSAGCSLNKNEFHFGIVEGLSPPSRSFPWAQPGLLLKSETNLPLSAALNRRRRRRRPQSSFPDDDGRIIKAQGRVENAVKL